MGIIKNPYIKELEDGQSVDGQFMVKEMARAETKNGKPFLILTIMDKTGDIGGRLWDNADQLEDECRPGNIVSLTGQVQDYKGTLQIKVDTVTAQDRATVDISRFMPAAAGNISEMALEITKLITSIRDPHIKKLLKKIFQEGDFFDRFQKAPAAKAMHHAYIGGLLEHTLAVTRLADMMAGFYSTLLDRDLLIAGALLHDAGKVEEFNFDSYPFNYTDKGRLVGHLVIGADMVQENANKIKDFPEELAIRLRHLILSHHGQHDFGSPCLPMMTEAFVLNFLDDMDAKVQYLKQAGERLTEDGYQWTDYQRVLERFLYVKGHTSREDRPEEKPAPIDSRQKSLF